MPFAGVDDLVRCYHCGNGLQKWKATDDPWFEHAKWFSSCDFLFLVKGEDFVNEIRKKSWSLFEAEVSEVFPSINNTPTERKFPVYREITVNWKH